MKLNDLCEESKRAGLTINTSKTEKMRINTSINQAIRISDGNIQRTSDFCYLGSIMSEKGGASKYKNSEGKRSFLQIAESLASQSISFKERPK